MKIEQLLKDEQQVEENFVAHLARSDGAFFTGMRRRTAPKPIVTPKKQNKKKDKKKDASNRRTRSKRSR